jgi:histidyl-tRNA synthetase
MTISIPPGVFDILPVDSKEKWRSVHLWQFIENLIRETAKHYGFHEIRTPLFERTELFKRSVGETSDIVSKEMYTFDDKGGRSMSLRPEGTAPVMRAFIEHKLFNENPVQKFYYICPMFRYERSQAGRYRQHHQFGVEAIGNGAPEQDAEIIDLVYSLYSRLGLKNLQVNLNSIGDVESRLNYKTALQKHLKQHYDHLSEDSKIRFETNPLRILDSKAPEDKEITSSAPSILEYLNSECQDHFEEVKNLLNLLKIPYSLNSNLVRGLDYYNKTVFEITAGELGAQNSVVGGGRYDGLMKSLGGPDLPAIGFGSGIERLLQTMLKQDVLIPSSPSPVIFFIALGETAKKTCFQLLHDLRMKKIAAQMDFSQRKLNKILNYADNLKVKYAAIIGENELAEDKVELKLMATGEKKAIPLSQLVSFLLKENNEFDLIKN